MNIHREARIFLNDRIKFYQGIMKSSFKNLSKSYLQIEIGSCVNQSLIDIHATHQNTQNQYTRNSLRKPIPNRHSRNWLREANCCASCDRTL